MIKPKISIQRSYQFGVGIHLINGVNMFGTRLLGLTISLLWLEATILLEFTKRF